MIGSKNALSFETWGWKEVCHPFAPVLTAWGVSQLRGSLMPQRMTMTVTEARLAHVKMPGTGPAHGISQYP